MCTRITWVPLTPNKSSVIAVLVQEGKKVNKSAICISNRKV